MQYDLLNSDTTGTLKFVPIKQSLGNKTHRKSPNYEIVR